MTKSIKYLWLFFILILFSCNKTLDNMNVKDEKSITTENWAKLSNKKIYFGHKSVGKNLIEGIKTNMQEDSNIDINIKEITNFQTVNQPAFMHSAIGKNTNPKSKIDAFHNIMNAGLGDNVDIAGFKFCYVDFRKGTNIFEVFDHYKLTINEISSKYPNAQIIHFTAPLRSIQKGPKAIIKKFIGRDIGIEDNLVRHEFNEMIRNEYKKKNIFDLAEKESTYPDGTREYTIINNEYIYSLIPAYTNDGGHLSEIGQKKIAADFLEFLIELNDK